MVRVPDLTALAHRACRLTLEKAQAWRMGRAADLVPLALHFLRLAPHAPPAVALDPLLASLDGTLSHFRRSLTAGVC